MLEASDDPTTPTRLLHSSFKDFLLDGTRVAKEFWINQSDAHYGLADRCLVFMESGLRHNVFNLEPDSLPPDILQDDINKAVSPALQYACRYWIGHLCSIQCSTSSGKIDDDLLGQIEKFLREHFLQWLEAFSLIGRFFEAEGMLKDLRSFISVSSIPPLVPQKSSSALVSTEPQSFRILMRLSRAKGIVLFTPHSTVRLATSENMEPS